MAAKKDERSGKTPAPSGGDGFEAAYRFLAAGKVAEAEVILRKVLTSDPDDAGALHLLGGIALGRGQIAAAEELVRRAIRCSPQNPEFHDNLGAVLLRQGKADEAIATFRTAIELDAGVAMTHNNLGNALKQKGDFEGAAAAFGRAIELSPDIAEVHSNLGTAYRDLGMLDQALACHRQALAIDPNYSGALNNLGNVLHIQGKFAEAEEAMRRALEIDPGYAMAYSNLGILLKDLGRYDEAEACLRRAIEAEPNFAMAYNSLGILLKDRGRYAEAEEAMRRALEIDPGYAMAYNNLGNLLQDVGRFEEAEENFIRALEIDPGYAVAKSNFAFTLLVQGDFARAWGFYTARDSVQEVPQELWQKPLPDDLNGKDILVLREQGLGDDIFFLRFAPALKERGAWICHDPDPKVASIVARFPFIDEIIGDGETPQGVDITLSAGDLPLALGMESIADIPPPVALAPEPGREEAMRVKLASFGPAPYVGVTWRAGLANKADVVFKLAPIGDIAEALRPANATVLVLQRHPKAGEIDALSRGLGREAHDLTALNDDLEDMLALLSLLDDYVTVSNTNVHLRASAGRTSRVLVPHPPEWRWMAAGDESPWFPGCAVYRQKVNGDWDGAFERLSRDLAADFPGVW